MYSKEAILAEAARFEKEAKRLKEYVENEYSEVENAYAIIDKDLNEWRKHLKQTTDKHSGEWALLFWSDGPYSMLNNHRSSYPSNMDREWSFAQYLKTDQNTGPVLITRSDNSNTLFPSSEAGRTRLELLGFSYLIVPHSFWLSISDNVGCDKWGLCADSWRVFGLDKKFTLGDPAFRSRMSDKKFLDKWAKSMQKEQSLHKKVLVAKRTEDKD